MRQLARALPFALVGALLSAGTPPSAVAVTRDVSISGFAFQSASITVTQGTTVRWTNNDGTTHSSESKGGFWSSPDLMPGDVYTQTAAFRSAGAYGYFCRQHGTSMSGVVRVSLKAPSSAANGFTLRWSRASSTPTTRGFDVQKMAPGTTTWTALRTNTQTRSAFLNPTRNGVWKYRARTDNRSNGSSSGWSPTRSVRVS